MEESLKIIQELEDSVEGVLSTLDKQVSKANSELFDLFNELYYSLDRSNGSIRASVKNLKAIDAFRSKLSNELSTGTYSEAVSDYLASFKDNSKLLNSYFSSVVLEFKDNSALYKAILDYNVNTTADMLLSSGVDANFEDVMIRILKDNVVSGSNRAEFIKTIQENLIDNSGRLGRYVSQVAGDSITQFNSNYLNSISADLGLKHYYYKGTKIADTRSFCGKLAGHVYTEQELKDIVVAESAGKGWSGMIAGTNWSNFPIYRGGWRCRHYLLPISQELYDMMKGGV
jgi:hypothetical protein